MYSNGRTGDLAVELMSGASEEVVIIAPYIKKGPLEYLITRIPPQVSRVTCVTRWLPEDIASGVCDLEILAIADSERGRRLLVHPNLHAKYYRADRRCLIGSANVTRRGLGWASPSNVELLVEISSEQTGIMDWETALLSSAIEATPELQTQIQLRADEIRSQRVIARPPEVDSIREEAQPTTRWVPRCSMPDVLWEVYAGGESGQRLLEGTRVASNQDLEALGPPRGLSKALFEAYVTTIMKRMPLIVEIDDRAIHGLTDTGAHEFLTDYLGDELPYSPQETWGIIKAWLTHFMQSSYIVQSKEDILMKAQRIGS